METEDRQEGYIETFRDLTKRTGSIDAAIAIMQELAKDHRQIRINGNGQRNSNGPATEKQLSFLDKLGVSYPEGVTKQAASQLIDEHHSKADKSAND